LHPRNTVAGKEIAVSVEERTTYRGEPRDLRLAALAVGREDFGVRSPASASGRPAERSKVYK